MDDPVKWSSQQVSEWLKNNGFQRYSQQLCVEHQLDGQGLLNITEDDLKQPPIEIPVLGDLKRLVFQIENLKNKHLSLISECENENRKKSKVQKHSGMVIQNGETTDMDCEDINQTENEIKPEKKKTFISLFYFLFCMYTTCYSIAVVQENVPDQHTHPPLPDIFLDNFPELSWASKVPETIILVLLITWVVIGFSHKHRWILIRRTFCLMGTMYLLRGVCVLITQLPVPETNVQCIKLNYTGTFDRIQRAVGISMGGGMKVTGLRTCGDYMFSGHTVMLTLSNFFITEYTPKSFCWLHIVSWMANLFGMFFILAGHGHYSIDVFVAFVLTSRLFVYYHAFANNINLMSRDQCRRKLFFPLFSYFESNTPGVIPNQYDLPSYTKITNYFRGYQLLSFKDRSSANAVI